MTATLQWLLNLDSIVPGGSDNDTYRSSYEKTLSDRSNKPLWAIENAEKGLTPPPTDDLIRLAGNVGISEESASDWVSVQLMMFLELSRQRSRGQHIMPLNFADIEAYQRLNTIHLHAVELNNILLLDQTVIAHFNKLVADEMAQVKQKSGT